MGESAVRYELRESSQAPQRATCVTLLLPRPQGAEVRGCRLRRGEGGGAKGAGRRGGATTPVWVETHRCTWVGRWWSYDYTFFNPHWRTCLWVFPFF